MTTAELTAFNWGHGLSEAGIAPVSETVVPVHLGMNHWPEGVRAARLRLGPCRFTHWVSEGYWSHRSQG